MTRRANAAPTAMGTILLSGMSRPHTRGAGEGQGWERGRVGRGGNRGEGGGEREEGEERSKVKERGKGTGE